MHKRFPISGWILASLLLSSAASAATITVNSTSGAASLANACTLRAAIRAANQDAATNVGACSAGSGADTIVFAPLLAGLTITLNEQDNFWYGPNGLPPIYSNITLDGGSEGITIARDASAPKFRFFYVAGRLHPVPVGPKTNPPSPGTLTLRRVTLTGGLARGGHTTVGGGGAGLGGAIYSQGSLRVEQSALIANLAEGGSSLLSFGTGGGGIGGGGIGGDAMGNSGGGFRDAAADHGGDFLAAEGGRDDLAGTSDIGGSAVLIAAGGFQADGVGTVSGDGGGAGLDRQVTCTTTGAAGFLGAGAFGGGAGGDSLSLLCQGGGGVGGGGSGVDVGLMAMGSDGGFGGGAGIFSIGGFGGGNHRTQPPKTGGFGGGGVFSGSSGLFGGNGSTSIANRVGSGGAGMGGAIFNHFGSVVVLNATLDGNRAQGGQGGSPFDPLDATTGGGGGAGLGGAVFNLNGVVRIESSTLSNNQAVGGLHGGRGDATDGQGVGGAVFNHFQADGVGNTVPAVTTTAAATQIILEDAILADSTGNTDCWNNTADAASIQLSQRNLIETNAAGVNACGSPSSSADPQLGPLQNSGGATVSRVPNPGSPAIDAARDCPTPGVDQRALTRPLGPNCDLGATEAGYSRVSIGDQSRSEGNSGNTAFSFALVREGDLAFPASIQATTVAGSAISGTDYTALLNQNVSFAAGAATATLDVPVSGDLVVEVAETFFVNLTGGPDVPFNDAQGRGTILNDDNAGVLISVLNVQEGNSNQTITLGAALSQPVDAPVSVNVSTADNTAIAPGDYLPLSNQTLTFPSLSTANQTFSVTLVGDDMVEPDESFRISASGLLAIPGVSLGPSAQIGILNDDSATLTLSGTNQAEGNSNHTLSLAASLSHPVQGPVTVNVSTVDGTAVAPSDFAALSGVALTFADRTFSQSLDLAIVGDDVVELDESFSLALSGLSAPPGVSLAAAPSITLQNDDSVTLSVASASQAEGNASNTLNLLATLSAPVQAPVSVTVSTVDGSATAGSDYTALNSVIVNFPSLSTSQTFPLTVLGDQTVERNETLSLNLSGLSAPSHVRLRGSAPVITLANDDTALLRIAAVSQAEGNSPNTIALNASLSQPVDGPVSVNVSTVDGSALGGSDYTALTNQTLSFAALSTSTTLPLQALGDTVVEADESLSLSLSGLTGLAGVSLDAAPTLILQNDDSAVLSITNLSRAEGNASNNAVLSANLSQPVDVPVTVMVSSIDGSALSGSDYTALSNQSVTFPALNTSQNLSVPVLGDAVVEPDESLSLRLSGLSAPSAVSLSSDATLTLLNDDSGPLLRVSKRVTLLAPNFVTYQLEIENSGAAAQMDNPGPELVDVLPASLSLRAASASTGVLSVVGQTVNWDGPIPAAGTVTITLSADIQAPIGSTIINQASVNYDANNDGSNESMALSDNPNTSAPLDATLIGVAGPIPTLSAPAQAALLLLVLLLGAHAVVIRKP